MHVFGESSALFTAMFSDNSFNTTCRLLKHFWSDRYKGFLRFDPEVFNYYSVLTPGWPT